MNEIQQQVKRRRRGFFAVTTPEAMPELAADAMNAGQGGGVKAALVIVATGLQNDKSARAWIAENGEHGKRYQIIRIIGNGIQVEVQQRRLLRGEKNGD